MDRKYAIPTDPHLSKVGKETNRDILAQPPGLIQSHYGSMVAWYICRHEWLMFTSNVGKYTRRPWILLGIFVVTIGSGRSNLKPKKCTCNFKDYPFPTANWWVPFWCVPSLKLTFSPLKMDGWNTIYFPIGSLGLFSGANFLLVSGRVNSLAGLNLSFLGRGCEAFLPRWRFLHVL